MRGMKWTKNPYERNKHIVEDENTYEDHNTILLINLIVELVVTTTLSQAEVAENQPIPKENNNKSNPSI